jgi:hypothetical protein
MQALPPEGLAPTVSLGPSVAAGLFGLHPTTVVYSSGVILLGLVALGVSILDRARRSPVVPDTM